MTEDTPHQPSTPAPTVTNAPQPIPATPVAPPVRLENVKVVGPCGEKPCGSGFGHDEA